MSLIKKNINVFLSFDQAVKIDFFKKILMEYFLKKNELNFIIEKKPSAEDLALKAFSTRSIWVAKRVATDC